MVAARPGVMKREDMRGFHLMCHGEASSPEVMKREDMRGFLLMCHGENMKNQ